MTRRIALIVFTAGLSALTGCNTVKHTGQWGSVHTLVAVIYPTEGNKCHGTVRFTDVDGGVKITADIHGLTPNAQHAFHIHDFGDATKGDGTSAGGHYNPMHMDHGRPEDATRHAGDFGNLQADAEGNARYERVDSVISLVGLNNPIIGRGVIVHAGQDKFVQPTGDAGSRIGIGVIGIANTQ